MDEFIKQFLLEARENVELATAELTALETHPHDEARIDSAFRGFHTLKGGAGIVGFAAMARAVHAAEDVLADVRSGARAISPLLIGDCLACLDQVVMWLDAMEVSGELPDAPETQAEAVVARFARATSERSQPLPSQRAAASADWADALLRTHADLRGKAVTAVRYAPPADCFFRGDDPLARIADLQGLLALEVTPALQWPPLDALDPFSCNVVLTALSESPRAKAAETLADVIDCCEIRPVATADAGSTLQPLSDVARAILDAQVALIADRAATAEVAARVASAGRVAANVLHHARRFEEEERVARATERSLAQHNAAALTDEIIAATHGGQPAAAHAPPVPGHEAVAARTLRVDASRIDALVKLTGELTVAKNALGHATKIAQDSGNPLAIVLKERQAVLERLVGELQQSVLALRVRPLQSVFQRFSRLVREISSELGKPARLVVEGGETQADKAIVEMLFEPLLHVIRNAMDHGIESAAIRAAANKPATATLRLRGERQQEHVVIEVSDDGAGLDFARIRSVALQRNLATAEALAAMTEDDLVNLIFAPGFSTASVVTGLSGRGVGMDTVRTAVRRVGGRVTVETRAGQGTTIRFALPFSVMMTRVMIVGTGAHTFGIPLDAVVENVRTTRDRVVPIGGSKAIVIRDRTVPVIGLADAVGLEADDCPRAETTLVVVRTLGALGALQVDRVGEPIEVLLQPLEGLLAQTRGIAGSTLLGDGSVLLILDIEELFS
jgi:two-component system chemotaxis sensor kinase CheA